MQWGNRVETSQYLYGCVCANVGIWWHCTVLNLYRETQWSEQQKLLTAVWIILSGLVQSCSTHDITLTISTLISLNWSVVSIGIDHSNDLHRSNLIDLVVRARDKDGWFLKKNSRQEICSNLVQSKRRIWRLNRRRDIEVSLYCTWMYKWEAVIRKTRKHDATNQSHTCYSLLPVDLLPLACICFVHKS